MTIYFFDLWKVLLITALNGAIVYCNSVDPSWHSKLDFWKSEVARVGKLLNKTFDCLYAIMNFA